MLYFSFMKHCSDDTWRVVLGEHNLVTDSGREQVLDVSQVVIHPDFDVLTKMYDIALLKLSSAASLNSYVQLGALPPSGEILPNNSYCYLTGWGRTSADGPISNELKQAFLASVDFETCSSPDWLGSDVKTTMVCAGGLEDSGCNVSLNNCVTRD
uniref:Elastase-1-like n=1 Tax=Acanthochromis polyacanthus TaxID=80966 RepID=A0A3Q1FNQ0_9TELE